MADWGAALAEQGAASDSAAATPAVAPAPPPQVKPAPFAELHAEPAGSMPNTQLDLVMDIPVTLSVELGRTKIQIRELLQLAQGSVVDLDRLAGEPMDVLVNGFLIARGEVVLVNDKFGIRLTDIVSPTERARRLG
jgi:flagellar motor switch protein FliN/FliY